MSSSTPRLVAVMALMGVVSLSLAGCNTVEGLGKDIQSAGQAVEKTAEKDK
ncbi:entericidin A/B family lipoprotein [Spiribacter onubensis]|uniref:Entericidin A/B family lipoprotein n=1 Tax=Spiribacter onubensis TaxID=3122420 RepID=A0ABV3SBS2_9GAMM